MKKITELTDADALEVANIIGGANHLSEDSRIYQMKDLLTTNRLYNAQTNIFGISWFKAFKYLESKGYQIWESAPIPEAGYSEAKCPGCGCNRYKSEHDYKECINCFQRFVIEDGEVFEIETAPTNINN